MTESLPKFGIEVNSEEEINKAMRESNSWGLNIFQIDECTNNHSLTVIGYNLFKEREILNIFKINPSVCVNFLLTLENYYLKEVPYHNSVHAGMYDYEIYFLPVFDCFFRCGIYGIWEGP